ncbi:hypothetical protein BDW66DRAFT_162776 [Aspergillus desertorum]
MSISNDDHVVLLLSCIQHSDIQKVARISSPPMILIRDQTSWRSTSPPSRSNATSPPQERPHREGKALAGDNGTAAGAGPSGINQGQTQNQTASGPARKSKKRKEPAPKEEGNGDEPAPKRKRGKPPKVKAQAGAAAEEENRGNEKEEEDISVKEEFDEAGIIRKTLGEDEIIEEGA